MLLLIALVTMYVFIALVYYSWRFRNMAKVSGSGHELRERYLHYSCAAVILMALVRCALHQGIMFLPRPLELNVCRAMMVTSRIVYNIAICLTYVHLWLRQRMFYTREELKHLRNKLIEFVDWLVLALILACSAVLAFVAFIPGGETPQITYHQNQCTVFEYNSKLIVHVYAGLAVTFQLALVALYIYPIIIQKLHQRKEKIDPIKATSSRTVNVYPALWSGIRRSFVLTVIIIVTDAVVSTLVWILTKKYPSLMSSIIALNDVNLIINVICAICTFRNWRKIVLGFPICRRLGFENDISIRVAKGQTQQPCEKDVVSSDGINPMEIENNGSLYSEERMFDV